MRMEAGYFACSLVYTYQSGLKLEEASFSNTMVHMYRSKFKIEAADALVLLYVRTMVRSVTLRRALVFNNHALTPAGA